MGRSSTTNWHGIICKVLLCALTFWLSPAASAQEIEIRRWNHLPIDQNFLTANYAHTDGEIGVDPELRLEDVSVSLDTCLIGYIRTYELLDRTARVEVRQAWQAGNWKGLIDGAPASASREGLSDTIMRFAVNLVGAPPLTGKAYSNYRAATKVETIVGAAIGLQLPTGQYFGDKLINLGSNRFTFRPQLGMHQQYYNWTFEVTGTVSIYTDNTSFFNSKLLQQDPYYAIDGSIDYSFPSGIWTSAGVGIGVGGQSEVNGVVKDNSRGDVGWLISAGFPITRSLGFKATYLATDHWTTIGIKSQTISIGLVGSW